MSERKICVVIQGPLKSHGLEAKGYLENKYNNSDPEQVTFSSKDHMSFYDSLLSYFDDLVFSTWEGEEGFGNYTYIYNKKVKPVYQKKGQLINNGNLQALSSLSGMMYFKEKYGENCIVVKIRPDIVFAPNILFNAVNAIHDTRVYVDHIMGLCDINDFIIAGKVTVMIDFFECNLKENAAILNVSHFDYGYNYMKMKYGFFYPLRFALQPYVVTRTKNPKNTKINRLVKRFEDTFSPLFTRHQFDELNLSWRGSYFKSSELYAHHFDRQIFKGDNNYMKKIDKDSNTSSLPNYLLYRLKHFIKKTFKKACE